MRKLSYTIIIILLLGGAVLAAFLLSTNRDKTVQARLITQALSSDISGFQRAESERDFIFPNDHGPHPHFQTEWWYYTGNLEAEGGQQFGYQLTFFRRALTPTDPVNQRQSTWGTNQAYLAHFALTDIGNQDYQAFERLSRAAAGLAGAQAFPFQVWLDDWRVEEIPSLEQCPDTPPCAYRLIASQGSIKLDLTLFDRKGPIPQGERGLSRKGDQAGQASYYYSLTRLESNGRLTIGDRSLTVSGWSWMDHEFSTSALAAEQVGWDWFSIHLDDGSELMLFQIRRVDGSIDRYSSGALIAPDGSTTQLKREDFEISVLSTWKSPHSAATYPAGWKIKIPASDLELEIRPLLADQELNLSYSYWEGSVEIEGQRGQQTITGQGYVEMTGYAGSMGGEF